MKIKNLTTISLFIFWAVVVATLTAGLVFYQNNKTNNQVAGNTQNNGTSLQVTLNLAEVAKHNLASDCWVIVNDKVYNLTSFASLHSGGSTAIDYNCGKDGTMAYNTKGGSGAHRQGDLNILANYYVGDLGQTVTQQTIQQNLQKINSVPAQNRGNEFEDD